MLTGPGFPPGDFVVFELTLCWLLSPQTTAPQSLRPVLSQAPSCRMKRGCRQAPTEAILPPSSGRTVRSRAAPLPFPQLSSSLEHPRRTTPSSAPRPQDPRHRELRALGVLGPRRLCAPVFGALPSSATRPSSVHPLLRPRAPPVHPLPRPRAPPRRSPSSARPTSWPRAPSRPRAPSALCRAPSPAPPLGRAPQSVSARGLAPHPRRRG